MNAAPMPINVTTMPYASTGLVAIGASAEVGTLVMGAHVHHDGQMPTAIRMTMRTVLVGAPVGAPVVAPNEARVEVAVVALNEAKVEVEVVAVKNEVN